MKFLMRNVLRGFMVLAPIYLTGYVFYLVFKVVNQWGEGFLNLFTPERMQLWAGIGFIVTLCFFAAVGYVSTHWLGAKFFDWIERQLATSPATRGIYGAIRDTLSALLGREKILNKVVLIHFHEMGFKRVGFITQENPTFFKDGSDWVIVYCPHSFQVSGSMFIVPRRNVEFLDIPADKALKMLMSGGILSQ